MTKYNTCTICGEVKPTEDFIKDKRIKRGYRNQCKACESVRVRGVTSKGCLNRMHSRNLVPEAEIKTFDFIRKKVKDATGRCTRHGRDMDLDLLQLYEIYKTQKGICALSGLPMILEKGSYWMPSLDRIDSGKGYVSGNVQWTCWCVNRAKGDLDQHSFEKMIKACYSQI